MDIKQFKVGQTAYYTRGCWWGDTTSPQEVTATKVGRKYVTVKGAWGERRFSLMDWSEAKYLIADMEDPRFSGRLYATLEDYKHYHDLEKGRMRGCARAESSIQHGLHGGNGPDSKQIL